MTPCLPPLSNSAAFIAICTSSAQGRSQLAIQTNSLSAKGPLPCNGLKADKPVCRQKQQGNRSAPGWLAVQPAERLARLTAQECRQDGFRKG